MRKRIISPYTEIQAIQPNEMQDFNKTNFITLIDDILGATTGVAVGLTPSLFNASSRIVGVSEGTLCDGEGIFYELLTSGSVTLPANDGTYMVYAATASTTGSPTSGYTLIDVSTQAEDFQLINTLTYDSVSLTYTSGSTIPQYGARLANATIAGGILTTVTDIRQYLQIGATSANSLQGFVNNSLNSAHIANQITGTVLENTSAPQEFIKVKIDNAYAGNGFYVDAGTNTGATGYTAKVNGNVGFIATGDGIGFQSETTSGFVARNNNSQGYLSDENQTGYYSRKNGIAFYAEGKGQGYGSSGFVSMGSNFGFRYSSEGMSGAAQGFRADLMSATGGSTFTAYHAASYSNEGRKVGFVFTSGSTGSYFFRGVLGSAYNTGIELINRPALASTGMIILGSNSSDYGIIIKNANTPIQIIDSDDTYSIDIFKNGGTDYLTNAGVRIDVSNDATAIKLVNSSNNAPDNIYGIFASKTGTANFDSIIYATDYETGISLGNLAGKTAIGIAGADSTDSGIVISQVANPIVITNTTVYGGAAERPAIDIEGSAAANTSIDGINIDKTDRAINVTNSLIGFRAGNSCTNHLFLDPLAANPATVGDGYISLVLDGSGHPKLRVYDSVDLAWKDCN
jgi:hypothetical protein